MKFSWIILSIALFFVGLCAYTMNDSSQFWTDFFYVLNGYVTIIGLAFNFKKDKTVKEMGVIAFFLAYRLLIWIYFIIVGIILDVTPSVMQGYLSFLIFFGISSFIGILFWYRKTKTWNSNTKSIT